MRDRLTRGRHRLLPAGDEPDERGDPRAPGPARGARQSRHRAGPEGRRLERGLDGRQPLLDWGLEGFFDTIENLKGAGLEVVGAGPDIDEARAPVIVEANGVRVAFLAYSSILPQSYWAEANRAGCAPMRAFTLYEQIEHDQPGTPARIHTYAHRQDLAALTADIAAAREAGRRGDRVASTGASTSSPRCWPTTSARWPMRPSTPAPT